MADPTTTTEDSPESDLAERLKRLEQQLASQSGAKRPDDEVIAERVAQLLAERSQAATTVSVQPADPVPSHMAYALTAARMAQSIFHDPNRFPPGVANPSEDQSIRSWLLHQVFGEFRLIFKMYFDPRYRMSRFGQFGVPLILGFFILNYFVFNFTCAVPIAGAILERLVAVVLAVVLYKLLAREASRYKQVLEYLARYGYA
jgi:hypothetical protein